MSATLRGTLVEIRPLTPADATPLGRILRDRLATRYLPWRVQLETGPAFVRRVLGEQRRGEGFSFAIVTRKDSRVVGQVRLFDWSRHDRCAEVGIWLRRDCWGRGYGSEAVRLVCRFGFGSMKLHRVIATVGVPNKKSDAMLRRIGFQREGLLRSSALVRRAWLDMRVYGLLRGELRRSRAS